MIDSIRSAFTSMDDAQRQIAKMTEKIYSAAQPGAVYGEPVVSGNYTIIPASEVSAGGGFGFGRGFGSGPADRKVRQLPRHSLTARKHLVVAAAMVVARLPGRSPSSSSVPTA